MGKLLKLEFIEWKGKDIWFIVGIDNSISRVYAWSLINNHKKYFRGKIFQITMSCCLELDFLTIYARLC